MYLFYEITNTNNRLGYCLLNIWKCIILYEQLPKKIMAFSKFTALLAHYYNNIVLKNYFFFVEMKVTTYF